MKKFFEKYRFNSSALPQVRSPRTGRSIARLESLEDRIVPTLNPTGQEQEMLEHVNRMRAYPQAELQVLFTSLSPLVPRDPDAAVQVRLQNDPTTSSVQADWPELRPAPPLAWNEAICAAAEAHSRMMIQQDAQSHQLYGEPDLGQRLINAGYKPYYGGENIFAYSTSAFNAHSGFAIDWGNPQRGHRVNMMNSNFRDFGVGMVAESNSATGVGPLVVTQDFGSQSSYGNPFMLGVVYRDGNGNQRYDSGEGLGGVTIQVSGANGTFVTTTMSAGGYQIKVPSGTYKVVASGGGLVGVEQVSSVQVAAANCKVDFDGRVGTGANLAPDGITISSSSVPENSAPGAMVGNLMANDPNARSNLSFALVAGSGSADNGSFSISGNSLRAATTFDFESRSTCSVRVRVTDQGGLSFEKMFTISVTNVNEAPTGLSISSTIISENAGANAVVGTITTVDPDLGDGFAFMLVAGAGSTDNGAFAISGGQLKARSSLDFEAKSTYFIRVRATDRGGLFIERSFGITVTNVNEALTGLSLSSSNIVENAGKGVTIGAFSALDADYGDAYTFELVSGVGDSGNSKFSISGGILSSLENFDFEAIPNYSIRVRATDLAGHSFERPFLIVVTDANEPPQGVALSRSMVPDGSPIGSIVGAFSTIDTDRDGTFSYSFVMGDGSEDNSLFLISSNQIKTVAAVSFGLKSSYRVRVRATDQGGLRAEQAFTILVDRPPSALFISSIGIMENSAPGTIVGTFFTTDENLGDGFTYSLVPGEGSNDNAAFTIIGSSLKALPVFDFEMRSQYLIRVRTTDLGGLFFERNFVIAVVDMADGPTIMTPSPIGLITNQPTLVAGLSVVDTTAGSARLTTTLSVGAGRLTLPSRTGLVFLVGDGISDTVLKFTGTMAQTNAAIGALTYLTAPDSLAPVTVSIQSRRGGFSANGVVSLVPIPGKVARVADPVLPGKLSVVIQGTEFDDTVSVQTLGGLVTNYTVVLNGNSTVVTGVTGRFVVFGLGGDDMIDLSASRVVTRADGGGGNDVILGGRSADVLLGGGGADLLAGGLGADNIQGGSGNDIMADGGVTLRLAGGTLRSILDGWAAVVTPVESDYATITADLAFTPDKTCRDTLTGGLGADWFWSPDWFWAATFPGAFADRLDRASWERGRAI